MLSIEVLKSNNTEVRECYSHISASPCPHAHSQITSVLTQPLNRFRQPAHKSTDPPGKVPVVPLCSTTFLSKKSASLHCIHTERHLNNSTMTALPRNALYCILESHVQVRAPLYRSYPIFILSLLTVEMQSSTLSLQQWNTGTLPCVASQYTKRSKQCLEGSYAEALRSGGWALGWNAFITKDKRQYDCFTLKKRNQHKIRGVTSSL